MAEAIAAAGAVGVVAAVAEILTFAQRRVVGLKELLPKGAPLSQERRNSERTWGDIELLMNSALRGLDFSDLAASQALKETELVPKEVHYKELWGNKRYYAVHQNLATILRDLNALQNLEDRYFHDEIESLNRSKKFPKWIRFNVSSDLKEIGRLRHKISWDVHRLALEGHSYSINANRTDLPRTNPQTPEGHDANLETLVEEFQVSDIWRSVEDDVDMTFDHSNKPDSYRGPPSTPKPGNNAETKDQPMIDAQTSEFALTQSSPRGYHQNYPNPKVELDSILSRPEEDDVATDHSDSSSLPSDDEDYIIEVVGDSLSKLWDEKPDQETLQRVVNILPGVLEDFALKLGYKPSNLHQQHLDVMYCIYKSRDKITQAFRDGYAPPDTKNRVNDEIPSHDKVEMWLPSVDSDTAPEEQTTFRVKDDLFENSGSKDEMDISKTLLNFDVYQKIILESTAYEWLLGRIRREIHLTSPGVDSPMNQLRQIVMSSLSIPHKISRKRPPDLVRATFDMDWNLAVFVRNQQYKFDAPDAALTLTGFGEDVQALTAGEYLRQTWPSTGDHVLNLLQEAIRKGPTTTGFEFPCTLPDHTELDIYAMGLRSEVEVSGTIASVLEIAEIFAWLGSAFRSLEWGALSGVWYCTPSLRIIFPSKKPGHSAFLAMKFEMEHGKDLYQSEVGTCWHNMFNNAVVVKDYPVPRRVESGTGTGLEMPLHVMAALAGTRFARFFDDKLFIKSFSTMLVPVKIVGDMLLWHYMYNKDRGYLSYLDNTATHAENIGFSDLFKFRHVVGWCSEAKLLAGDPDANYDIDKCDLDEPHGDFVLEKLTLSGGKGFTIGGTVAVGVSQAPLHLIPDGDDERIKFIAKKFVVLWDQDDCRGWLVDGASALLHLLHASLEIDKTDVTKNKFIFESDKFAAPTSRYTPQAAVDFLQNEENMKVKLFAQRAEISREDTRKEAGQWERTEKKKISYYCVEDRVERIWTWLEQSICYQIRAAGMNGVNLKLRPRNHLEGWDFRRIAEGVSPCSPRIMSLKSFGKGWVDFTRSIQAVTLFGRGFGELIRPEDDSNLCAAWTAVPTGKFYLATCIPTLRLIMRLEGEEKDHPMRVTRDILWHVPAKQLSGCRCRGQSSGKKRMREKHTDLVQVLWPRRLEVLLPKRNPVPLPEHGAVIFGHNVMFKYRWKDEGEPERGPAPLPSKEPEIIFQNEHDSGIGSSGSRSAPERTEDPGAPIPDDGASTISLYSKSTYESARSFAEYPRETGAFKISGREAPDEPVTQRALIAPAGSTVQESPAPENLLIPTSAEPMPPNNPGTRLGQHEALLSQVAAPTVAESLPQSAPVLTERKDQANPTSRKSSKARNGLLALRESVGAKLIKKFSSNVKSDSK